jgi:hypothetical protein
MFRGDANVRIGKFVVEIAGVWHRAREVLPGVTHAAIKRRRRAAYTSGPVTRWTTSMAGVIIC